MTITLNVVVSTSSTTAIQTYWIAPSQEPPVEMTATLNVVVSINSTTVFLIFKKLGFRAIQYQCFEFYKMELQVPDLICVHQLFFPSISYYTSG